MIILALLAICLMFAIAFSLASLSSPGSRSLRSLLVLKICLAAGLTIGISSCTYFAWMLVGGPSRTGLIIVELVMCMAMLGLLSPVLKKQWSASDSDVPTTPANTLNGHWLLPLLSVCMFVALSTALTRFIFVSLAAPHGEVDAITMWNLRARFLARAGEQPLDSFISLLATHNPDYPLLVPAGIARWWTYVGSEPVVTPILVAMLFTFSTIGLAVSSVSFLRSRGQGLLAGLVLLGTPFLIRHGASQYADIPLSFFMLASLVSFSLADAADRDRGQALFIAGLTAGFSAWTKNEGLLFVLVVIGARMLVVVSTRGWTAFGTEMRSITMGLVPLLLIVLFFKLRIAPGTSPIVSEQGAVTTVERLTDLSRYFEAGQAFLGKAMRFGHPGFVVLLVYFLLVGRRVDDADRVAIRHAAITIGLMLVGYFMVFIVTPHGVSYQIATSLDRLWIHLWPSMVFMFFLLVKTPEEAMAPQSPASDEMHRSIADRRAS